MGIAGPHIVKRGVEPGIEGQVKLLGGVVGQRHPRGGGLGVVDKHVNAAKGPDGLINDPADHRLIVAAGGDIGPDRQDFDAIKPFQLLPGFLQLLEVPAGDDQIASLLGVSDGDAVTDRAAAFPIA